MDDRSLCLEWLRWLSSSFVSIGALTYSEFRVSKPKYLRHLVVFSISRKMTSSGRRVPKELALPIILKQELRENMNRYRHLALRPIF